MQLTIEQIVVSALGGGASLSIIVIGFFLKTSFTDIKKELIALNINVQALIVQGSNSSLRHDRTEAEVTNIRQRIHHLENVVTQVSLVQQRCDFCNGRE